MTINVNEKRTTLSRYFLWAIFILYIILLSYSIIHHELWADEIHSWNIAKGSTGFSDLISNTRYEGHPPVWYVILWTISKFSHDLFYLQAVQCAIAILSVALIIFISPFSHTTKAILPFGYFFLFEYGVLSRNYAIGILLALSICIIIRKKSRYRIVLYYILLFLLSNTHLLALILAASIHIYYMFFLNERQKNHRTSFLHILTGVIILLPSAYFILPPSNSQLNIDFWLNKWSINQLIAIVQSPVRAFIPMPAWWKYNFWNTEFLLDAQSGYTLLKFINPLISLLLLALIFFVLKESKKSLALFFSNIIFSFAVSILFPLTSERYAGFIFIGFIASYWLYCYERPKNKNNDYVVNGLLIIQLVAGIFSTYKDARLPFSNSYKINELLVKIPADKKIVTNYWALNTLSAFKDKPFYCIEMQKEISFLLWDEPFSNAFNKQSLYSEGIRTVFNKEASNQLYMISTQPPEKMEERDSLLFKDFNVRLVDKKEGAIEKGSNFYLYEVSLF